MGYFSGVNLNSGERFVYAYSGITQPELENIIDSSMQSIGYKHLGNGVYEKGSRTMRLLFGAFCKYFKFEISMDASDPQNILVGVKKASSGMSGGLIGMNQIKNEMTYLSRAFQSI